MGGEAKPAGQVISLYEQITLLVPEVPLTAVLNGALKELALAPPDDPSELERAIILTITAVTDAQTIFEFGPSQTSLSAEISDHIEDRHIAVTGQSKSGVMNFDPARIAGLLSQDAIARTEVIRHVDSFYGRDARLYYAMYVDECHLVIVDATHDYKFVKCDSLTALHLVEPGGIVVWCDYGRIAGVTHCLNELYRNMPRLHTLRHITGTSLCIWQRSD